MEAYTSFAQVYDLFMDNVPYEEWSEYVISLLKEEKIEDGLVLDLGCGTGKMTRLLAAAGYDMIGIDNSEDMLEIARECQYSDLPDEPEDAQAGSAEVSKKEDTTNNILYLLQDMREFELYGTVRAVISICDSMNYILEEEDLLQVFKLVNNYLDPKGIFIFDMNTRYKYAELLGDTTITENREEGSFIWENYFDEEDDINQYDLTLFIREEGDLYRKYEETHYQRVYDLDIVKRLLKEAGMEFVAAYDAFTREPVREGSERIYIVARECGK
ncbi:MAG: class I SAM-dependent methyltransferase [Lachnospiraceae bacterium]|nr:class I SAM-dependent methyltransferase [Lachnospiraceae bacterium]